MPYLLEPADPRGGDRTLMSRTALEPAPDTSAHKGARAAAERTLLLFDHVSKWYGPVIGVNQVTLELRPGITGLVGANGAGKSTLLRLATGQLRPDLGTVRVEGLDGKVIAHAVNFAAHPVMTVERDMRFSADYPGAMAAVVEAETHAPCLFLQGAAGDLSPNNPPPTQWEPVAFGQMLGKEVLSIAEGIHCQAEDKPALQSYEQDFQFKTRVDLRNPLIKGVFVKAFFKDLVDFYDREYREGSRPHLSVSLLNQRIGFVGVSGEFYCRHSLDLKRRARLDHVFFLGYCNDYQQYFPTIEAAAEGGYGADAGVSTAEVGAGERIMDRALVNLYKMRGKLADLPPRK